MVRRVKWQMTALELSGEISSIGIHAEGGTVSLDSYDDNSELPDELKDHSKYLIGIDYTFESGLHLIWEYYFEGLGETDDEDYSLNQRMAYLTGEMDSIGRDNHYFGISYPLSDFTILALYTIVNASDSSVIANPWFTWIAADDITVNLSAQIASGKESPVLGRTGSGLFARVNFSF